MKSSRPTVAGQSRIAVFLLAFVAFGALLVIGAAPGGAAGGPSFTPAPVATPTLPDPVRTHDHGDWFRHVCAVAEGKAAGCGAQVVSNSGGTPLASTSPPSSAYGPSQFHTAYSLPAGPSTETIGIVDAYDDPTIESDLAAYDTAYGLPECSIADGCFRKVNQTGGTTYPSGNSWHLEIALDVETAHEICQTCKILLVEATSNSLANLGASVDEAVKLGANVVSNSYGGSEYSGETTDESAHYNHPGVVITASSGDGGYGVEFPAASRYVTAVGGTTLTLNSDKTWKSEAIWSGAGSGCSAYVTKPSWQTDTGCPRRTVADVSADADPNTGAAVYDSVGARSGAAWYQVGGTSLAAPLIGAVYALAGNTGLDDGATPYAHTSALHDVTTGSNGSCGGSYLCAGGAGYDGPSGLGSPNGIGAFQSGAATPDFALGGSPSSSTVPQGGTTSYAVTMTAQNGFADSVSLNVTGLPSGASASFAPTFLSTGTSLSSTLSVTTTAAIAPGTYPLTISGADGMLTHSTAATLVISGPAPTLTVSPSTIGGGGAVTASWANVASPTKTDWIGVFNHGAPNSAYLSLRYTSSCTGTAGSTAKASGSCSVTMPTTAGTYDLRLLANNGFTLLASASPVTVTAAKATPTLSTTASTGVTIGGSVTDTATLSGGSTPTGTIVFSLYGPGNSTCTGSPVFTSTKNAAASVGSDPFVPTVAGTYLWVAAYSGDSKNNAVADACNATTESVTVTAAAGPSLGVSTTSLARGTSLTVTWSGVTSASRNDLIGVFVPGDPNTAYLSFIYDSTCTTSARPPARASGSCSFTMPSSAGTYQLRLLGKGSTLLATSPNITTT